jgi:hypothetical protein
MSQRLNVIETVKEYGTNAQPDNKIGVVYME